MTDITLQNNQSLTLRLKACGLSSADIKKILAALSPELENKANTDLENVDVEAFKAKADAAGVGGGGITENEVEEMLRMFADTVVSVKADKNDVYTKIEHEESVGRVIDGIVLPAIAKKADKDDVYLKDEIDLRLGDVDLALDRIIEIQNSFMPGGDA